MPPPEPGKLPGADQFRNATWLVENAKHVRRRASTSQDRLTVVLVGHTESLPGALLDELRDAFNVRIETQLYERICAQYPELVGRLGGMYRTFTFGFMRWLLIRSLYGDAPVLCYDGDVIHNMPLDTLSAAFRGITRTATSTAFAAISNPDWYRAWTDNLEKLNRDPAAFLRVHAARLKHGPQQFSTSPEEYFAKFLIEAGELPQDELDESFPCWIVPQPHLLPRLYNFVETRSLNRIPAPMRYARENGSDSLNGKPVAFWHMQKPFMAQLSALAYFREREPRLDPRRIYAHSFYGRVAANADLERVDPYHEDQGYDAVPFYLRDLALRLIKVEQHCTKMQLQSGINPFHPAFLYDYYFVKSDLSILFNNHRWPKPGCWST